MKQYHWLALALAALASGGCSEAAHKQAAPAASSQEPVAMLAPPPPPAAPSAADAEAQEAAPPAQPNLRATSVPAAGRLLVYHAEVRLKTTAMPRATARLDSLVRHHGGFMSAATETRADGEWRQTSTIRVPPARFQMLLSGLSGLGTVEEKKLSTDDVTAEHADVAARLQAKRAVERQYTALLGRAQKIKDVLDIAEKLGEVREDIEATESRLKALNDEVAYSTVALELYQPLPQTVPDAPVVSLGSRLVAAFYGGWQLLVDLLLGAVAIWPLLALGALGGGLWLRRRAKASARRPAAQASAATTQRG